MIHAQTAIELASLENGDLDGKSGGGNGGMIIAFIFGSLAVLE